MVRKLVVMVLVLAAVMATLFVALNLCSFDALAEEGAGAEQREVERPRIEPDEYDMDAALERIRGEESARLAKRVDVSPGPSEQQLLEERLTASVVKLQPWYTKRPRLARRLAVIIGDAAVEHGQDPFIALAMAYRESSLVPRVGSAVVVGSAGEEGYFQIMPNSYPRRVCGEGRDMGQPRANADTAMCYVAHIRHEVCETDDPWIYVAAYGARDCPTPEAARRMKSPLRRRATLCTMLGDDECAQRWPE